MQVEQVHSVRVVAAEDVRPGTQADGIVVTRSGIFAAVRTADCVPILIVDPQARAFAILHAGWKGTLGRIASAGVEALTARTGNLPQTLIAALGPAIRVCCYEVGEEVRRQYAASGHPVERIFSGRNLDLAVSNRLQLIGAGVPTVLDAEICTSCRSADFHSWRRCRDEGRNWAIAGFR